MAVTHQGNAVSRRCPLGHRRSPVPVSYLAPWPRPPNAASLRSARGGDHGTFIAQVVAERYASVDDESLRLRGTPQSRCSL